LPRIYWRKTATPFTNTSPFTGAASPNRTALFKETETQLFTFTATLSKRADGRAYGETLSLLTAVVLGAGALLRPGVATIHPQLTLTDSLPLTALFICLTFVLTMRYTSPLQAEFFTSHKGKPARTA